MLDRIMNAVLFVSYCAMMFLFLSIATWLLGRLVLAAFWIFDHFSHSEK
jgi:hypothetical protein